MGATMDNYALVIGGDESGRASKYTDYFDASLTWHSLDYLDVPMGEGGVGYVGGYALFAGGKSSTADYRALVLKKVYAFDQSLTRTTIADLTTARRQMGSASLEGFAIFAGGWGTSVSYYYDTVDVYDESLTRTTFKSLAARKYRLSGATVGNYALMAGGEDGVNYFNTVEAFTIA
jgi:hypothetical protein